MNIKTLEEEIDNALDDYFSCKLDENRNDDELYKEYEEYEQIVFKALDKLEEREKKNV